MELELGCKLTKRLDDFAYVDLLIAKDRTGPVFISKETGIMFILTAHLKGYTRDQIKIDINEDGSKILICGEKPAQEMVMVGWKVYKKEIEMRGFRKAFKIPDGVILDKIKARFNEDESMLTISMPKAIEGVGIEEVEEEEEEEEIAGGNSESLQVVADEEVDRETLEREESAESDGKDGQNIDKIPEKLSVSPPGGGKEVASKRNELLDLEGEGENEVEDEKVTEKPPENMPTDMQEHEASKWDQNGKDQLVREKKQIDGTEIQEERSDDEKSTDIKKKKFRDQSTQTDAPKRRPKKCCAPMIAGSAALLVPLMVFVIHLIRSNDKPSKKKQ